MSTKDNKDFEKPSPIYVVSGGTGVSGVQLVETVLVQFPDIEVKIIKIPHVREKKQIEDLLQKMSATGGIIVHTMVDDNLRKTLLDLVKDKNLTAIDLMGPLIDLLSETLNQKPASKPGLYRKLHKDYFERVDAINFTVNHDDGMNLQDLQFADIVLTGVSRCGKTPLSIYLSVLGWKVANVPLVMGIPLPKELYQIDRRRVFGLSIEYEQLLKYRKEREKSFGITGASDYTNQKKVFEEIEEAIKIFKKGGFSVIPITNKPLESSADVIIKIITARFPENVSESR